MVNMLLSKRGREGGLEVLLRGKEERRVVFGDVKREGGGDVELVVGSKSKKKSRGSKARPGRLVGSRCDAKRLSRFGSGLRDGPGSDPGSFHVT
jgi:hypothetical protein